MRERKVRPCKYARTPPRLLATAPFLYCDVRNTVSCFFVAGANETCFELKWPDYKPDWLSACIMPCNGHYVHITCAFPSLRCHFCIGTSMHTHCTGIFYHYTHTVETAFIQTLLGFIFKTFLFYSCNIIMFHMRLLLIFGGMSEDSKRFVHICERSA